ncbi:MAG: hypothetical protein ABH803_01525 [Candidatus Micrarchaeota archaeon]
MNSLLKKIELNKHLDLGSVKKIVEPEVQLLNVAVSKKPSALELSSVSLSLALNHRQSVELKNALEVGLNASSFERVVASVRNYEDMRKTHLAERNLVNLKLAFPTSLRSKQSCLQALKEQFKLDLYFLIKQ